MWNRIFLFCDGFSTPSQESPSDLCVNCLAPSLHREEKLSCQDRNTESEGGVGF